MNPVLTEILRTKTVDINGKAIPLHSNMDEAEGKLITDAFAAARPATSLEVGFAYGISALYACDSMASSGVAGHHIVLDPFQFTDWEGVGLANLCKAGFGDVIEHVQERSEIALPRLLASGLRIQAAIIDGWHTFDHALVDFFYVNKMLDVGGIVILDDMDYAGLAPLVDHIAKYPCYELFGATPINEPNGLKGLRRSIRRSLAKTLHSTALRRGSDYPSCVAFRKIAEDERPWDWH